jgi:hypothetical protein
VRLGATAAIGATVVIATAVAAAAPPRAGILVPGRSLGGVALGATEAQVRAAWGDRFGRCRACPHPTWYFNQRPFEPKGVGVEFRGGRVSALFTLWGPDGWRSSRGLRIGDAAARIGTLHGPVIRVECGGYAALTRMDGRTVTAFYVVEDEVWGFGLMRPDVPACR